MIHVRDINLTAVGFGQQMHFGKVKICSVHKTVTNLNLQRSLSFKRSRGGGGQEGAIHVG